MPQGLVAGQRGFGGDAGDADALIDVSAHGVDNGNQPKHARLAQASIAAEPQNGNLLPLPDHFDGEQEVQADQDADGNQNRAL